MLTGAIDTFRVRGVAGSSLATIVEQSGAPRGSLYHYFPDGKAQLATEATGYAGRYMSTMISALVNAEGPVEALGKIVDYFRDQLIATDYTSGCPIVAGALGADESDGARTAASEAFTSWEHTIATALWQHGLTAEKAHHVATHAIAAIEGALIIAKAQRSTRPLDHVGDELSSYTRTLLQ